MRTKANRSIFEIFSWEPQQSWEENSRSTQIKYEYFHFEGFFVLNLVDLKFQSHVLYFFLLSIFLGIMFFKFLNKTIEILWSVFFCCYSLLLTMINIFDRNSPKMGNSMETAITKYIAKTIKVWRQSVFMKCIYVFFLQWCFANKCERMKNKCNSINVFSG